MVKPYTGAGDSGKTSLLRGKRVWKDDVLVEAYGAVDEASSAVGLARSFVNQPEIVKLLSRIEYDLYLVNSDLGISGKLEKTEAKETVHKVSRRMVQSLEEEALKYNRRLKPLRNFILTGGLREPSLLHLARSVVRRAERRVVTLARSSQLNPEVIAYLNRLSSLLFVLARYVSKEAEFEEKELGGKK